MMTNNCCVVISVLQKHCNKIWPHIEIGHWTVQLKKVRMKDLSECAVTVGAIDFDGIEAELCMACSARRCHVKASCIIGYDLDLVHCLRHFLKVSV